MLCPDAASTGNNQDIPANFAVRNDGCDISTSPRHYSNLLYGHCQNTDLDILGKVIDRIASVTMKK
jgi:hypothetical protein